MSRLSIDTPFARTANPSVSAYGYAPHEQQTGIVHFGIGAFHRAHQAWYTDAAMNAGERDWAIAGVSMRSSAVMQQMNPQHGLYSVTQRDGYTANTRIIGSIREVLLAGSHATEIVNRLASPFCHIVSFTVTEKGYCRAADGSLDQPLAVTGFYPLLARAFSARRSAGLPGLTLLSCDNLAANGTQLHQLMLAYLTQQTPDLVDWFADNCTCPSTMVDRIVPATTATDLDEVAAILGVRDEAAVVTEPFSQWVIEDNFVGPRPCWEKHGAQMTADVRPFETAKLRMLNGAHSALAYLGLKSSYEYVHHAMADDRLAELISSLMRNEAATSLTPAAGQDFAAYADALFARFKNPALKHRLAQIAMDGSQKIPQRWLETLAYHQSHDQQCPAILAALGAWMCHVRGDHGAVDDPMAKQLQQAWDEKGASGIVDAIFGRGGLIASNWQPDEMARHSLGALMAG